MSTVIKRPVLCQTGLRRHFVIFDIRALWRSDLSVRVPGCQKFKWRINPVRHRMFPYGNSGCQRVNCSHVYNLRMERLRSQEQRVALNVRSAVLYCRKIFVHLSACVSVTIQYCVKKAKHILEILSPPDSAVIRVYSELNRTVSI